MQTAHGPQRWWLFAVALTLGAGHHAPGQQAKPWATLKGHTEFVTSLAFSPDGRTLASASFDGSVRLWEVASGKVRTSFRGYRGGVRSVLFITGDNLLASGGYDGTVRLWDLRARKQRAALKGHGGCVFGLAVAGKLLASTGFDGTVGLWDTSSGNGRILFKQARPLRSVAFTPDGTILAMGDGDNGGTVRLWSVARLLAQKGAK